MDFDKRLAKLPKGKRELAERMLAARRAIIEENPLQGFHACPSFCGAPECPPPTRRNPTGGRPKQFEFMAAPEEVIASNAGNRFGKTTAMVVWAIIQHCPEELLPSDKRLHPFRRVKSSPVRGRYLCPTEQLLEDTILPTFKKWMPPSILLGGGWDKAYRKQHNELYFADGGKLVFFTYKQDPNALAGASLDYVLWDEPPPIEHWRESGRIRTLDRGGCHRFGMTPVNMQGGGIGWIKREIFDRAKPDHDHFDPAIRIVRGSIWDNPDLDEEQIEAVLRSFPEDERQAREHGDFIHFGGMIYPGGFDHHLIDPPHPKAVEDLDVVVGIDPGLKNAAFVWVGFDSDNVAYVFDEVLVQEGTALDYAKAIRQVNSKWRLKQVPLFVIDPSARNRSLINRESIEGELAQQGIYCLHGQNQVQAGVQQVRRRLTEKGLHISKACRGLRAEADEYRMEDRPDGEFKPVKENDHRLDALRYALMSRPWYVPHAPNHETQGWRPGFAPSADYIESHDLPDPEEVLL